MKRKIEKSCTFCMSYGDTKNIYDFRQEHSEHHENKQMEYEITVAMVSRMWEKGKKRNAGRTTDYRWRGLGYKLNYCPECGRFLKWS